MERRRTAETRLTSWSSLGPGLMVAAVPTVLYALGDPGLTRSLGALVAGIALLVGGVVVMRRALVDVGSVIVVVLGLRQLAPVVGELPRWLVLGAGGAVLLAIGATFEQRRSDLADVRHRYAALF